MVAIGRFLFSRTLNPACPADPYWQNTGAIRPKAASGRNQIRSLKGVKVRFNQENELIRIQVPKLDLYDGIVIQYE